MDSNKIISLTAVSAALVLGACGSDDDPAASGVGGASGNGGATSGGSGAIPDGSGGRAVGGSGATGGDPSGAGGSGDVRSMDVALSMRAMVGGEAFSCTSKYEGLGTQGTALEPLDFRFYVEEVRLITSAGDEVPVTFTPDGKWQTEEVALLDFEDATGTCANGTPDRNDTILGTVPAGDYAGLAFTIGVPETRNHENPATAASPLNLSALHWNWNGGYKFMRIDFRVPPMMGMGTADGGMPMHDGGMGMPMDGGGMGAGHHEHGDGPASFNFHLGSTFCMGAPDAGAVHCERGNRPVVRFATFDLDEDVVEIDYANLVEGVNVAMNMGGAPGCMSGDTDPECAPMFPAVGLEIQTGDSSGTGGIFSKVAR